MRSTVVPVNRWIESDAEFLNIRTHCSFHSYEKISLYLASAWQSAHSIYNKKTVFHQSCSFCFSPSSSIAFILGSNSSIFEALEKKPTFIAIRCIYLVWYTSGAAPASSKPDKRRLEKGDSAHITLHTRECVAQSDICGAGKTTQVTEVSAINVTWEGDCETKKRIKRTTQQTTNNKLLT